LTLLGGGGGVGDHRCRPEGASLVGRRGAGELDVVRYGGRDDMSGTNGATGATGPAGPTSVRTFSNTVTPATIGLGVVAIAEISCPAGSVATGGGSQIAGASVSQQVDLVSSLPTGTPSNGWRGVWEQEAAGNGAAWSLSAYVLCTP
jgi:hypothetical protein